jgi:hypothetical protein
VTVTLPPGSYSAVFTLSGYKSETKVFTIKADQQISLTVILSKIVTPPPTNPPPSNPPPTNPPPVKPPPAEPKTGVLTINTSPSGAEVYVNGTFKGMSPLTLTLTKGSYTVKVVLEGYESASKAVTVSGGKTVRADFSLKKKSAGPAILRIFSNPDSAEVYIDGNLVGLTNDTFTIASGTHKILIRLEGYKDFVITVTVKEGETREIRATLLSK